MAMQSNPQMREIMERNPEMGRLLSDPQILRQVCVCVCVCVCVDGWVRGCVGVWVGAGGSAGVLLECVGPWLDGCGHPSVGG